MDNLGKASRFPAIAGIIFLILAVLVSSAPAQPGGMRGGARDGIAGSLTGTVVDSVTLTPLEYATIILFSLRDSSQVGGISTGSDGKFILDKLRPGRFYVKVNFLGYEASTIDSVFISPQSLNVDLGEIALIPAAINVEGIEVTAEKPSFEYKIDRKVINVSKLPTAVSGSAVDVLENAPSVSVDIEGNVSLRGSSNFQVLIDGRPSILDANDALEQIPATTIDNIEIITNPSAAYDPDGNSGIINVITKKNKLSGFSGVANLSAGRSDRYSGDILVSYRNHFYNAFVSVDYRKRTFPGSYEEENRTTVGDTVYYVNSDGDSDFKHSGYGIRTGADLTLSNSDYLSFGLRYGSRDGGRSSSSNHEEWSSVQIIHDLYSSYTDSDRDGDFYAFNLDFSHQFDGIRHKLEASARFSRRDMTELEISETFDINDSLTYGEKSTEAGPGDRWRFKLDYIRPVNETGKFETGLQGRIGNSDEVNEIYEYIDSVGIYEILPEYSHTTEYIRNIYAAFAIYSGEYGRIGYQLGLRGEYTYRDIKVPDQDTSFNIDRSDLFPTIHGSYKYSEKSQVMISYARKIDRPRGWWLEPFEFRRDAYTIQRGNPGLKPEYIDSYEAGYQYTFGRNMIALEGYYRKTNNKIEFIRSVYDENITLQTVENVGEDHSLGFELTFNYRPWKFWDMNILGDIYKYKVEGELNAIDYSSDQNTWRMRLNNTWNITKMLKLQANSRYHGKSVTAQGSQSADFMMDLAARYDIIPKVLNATLQVRDVFGSGVRERTTESQGYYSFSRFERDSPMVMLNLSYIFNNFKDRDLQRPGEDLSEDDF